MGFDQTEIIQKLTTHDSKWVTFSPDGRYLASAGTEKGISFRIWDVTTGRLLREFKDVKAPGMDAFAWSPSGQYLACHSPYSRCDILIYDIINKALVTTLRDHTYTVETIVWSPDNRNILFADNKGNMLKWDAISGILVQTFVQPTPPGLTINLIQSKSPITRSPEMLSQVISIVNEQIIQDVQVTMETIHPISEILFSSDSLYILYASDRSIQIWNVTDRNLITELPEGGKVLAWHLDGQQLFLSESSGSDLRIFNFLDGKVTKDLSPLRLSNCLSISPSGQYLALGTTPNNIRRLAIYDVVNERKKTVKLSACGVHVAAFSPDSRYLAFGEYILSPHGSDEHRDSVIIWDVVESVQVMTLEDHRSQINTIVFSPNGQYLASGSSDVRIWDFF